MAERDTTESSRAGLADALEADVRALAGDIGERNMHRGDSLEQAGRWLEKRFEEAGLDTRRHHYVLALPPYQGREPWNLVAEVRGRDRPDEILVVGAHYDTVPDSPGANDNGSAVAALLALAAWFRDRPQALTLRFVAFTNEEPPFFCSPNMGSHAYARQCHERGERIRAMMSMDGLGYFSEREGSQAYPLPGLRLIYPDRANFIAFVTRARNLLVMRRALKAFRKASGVSARGVALPASVPGVAWSDHWSFWQFGYPAFLVTDTLLFRDSAYHLPEDTPDRLDYRALAEVVDGLKGVLARLAG